MDKTLIDQYYKETGKTVYFTNYLGKDYMSWDYTKWLEKKLTIKSISNETNIDKPKLSVKCLHCGRKFIDKMPHKCNTGYRKRNLIWQEITEDEQLKCDMKNYNSCVNWVRQEEGCRDCNKQYEPFNI